ncbi:MAG: urease accessory protein UreD [Pseudomonadota bacterium]
MATLYLQSSSGGYYSGDDLSLDVQLEEGGALHLTSQASTIVHHARHREGACSTVSLRSGAGSFLEYCPDPTILLAGSALTSQVRLELGREANAILCDAQLSHDPEGQAAPFARLRNEIFISRAGVPILLDRIDLNGRDWAAATGGFGAAGTVIVTGGTQTAETVRSALAGLTGCYIGVAEHSDRDLTLTRILASDGAALSRALQAAWAAARQSLTGALPRRRRK